MGNETRSNLNKATILEEIEHPPAYVSSPFEEKMQRQSQPSSRENEKNNRSDIKSDPYREPLA